MLPFWFGAIFYNLCQFGFEKMEDWKSKDWKKCDFSKMVSHTSRKTMQILKDIFPGRLISRNGDLHWPPRSPDLTAPDYFLWGFF